MMKKIIWTAILFGLLLLAACGEEDDSAGAGPSTELIETDFTSPETADPGETMTLSVTVTQGEELVEDADEVVYEVWESGHRDASDMLTAEHIGDGVYEAEASFDEEGLYFIQAHTTARRLHVMPKQEIIVGNPDPESIVPDDSDDSDSKVDMEGHGH
ncbi:FixH family protein [Metaplanococcus flavidus]|uniref:FixH family protein n=1 Tax=Metaplanococcus flavidus TaxID=569883 RepID=A0ABW3L6W5_9BACL